MTRSRNIRRPLGLQVDAIAREYLAGDSTTALARRHGVGPTLITNVLREQGVEMRPCGRIARVRGGLPMGDVVALYATGLPLREVAARCGVSTSTIRRAMHYHGIEIRSSGARPAWRES